MRIESEGSYNSAANDDSLTVQNTIIAGIREVYFKTDVTAGEAGIRAWFTQEKLNNDTLAMTNDLKINDPFNYTSRNFLPMGDSRVLCGSIWASSECGINDIDEISTIENDISVYPNPVDENATLSVYLNKDAEVAVTICDITGKVIEEIEAGKLSAGENTLELNVEYYKAGLYFANVYINKSSKVIKLMVK
jgi:Secretion system C-terminal sorting domain